MKTKLIIALLVVTLLDGCGEQEIYVLPKGYEGRVLIILDQEQGLPRKYFGRQRIYEIPDSGILRTRFSVNVGWAERPHFYYDRIDNQNQIPLRWDRKDFSDDKVTATLPSAGVDYKNDHSGEIRFIECYVGTKSKIQEASRKAETVSVIELIKTQ